MWTEAKIVLCVAYIILSALTVSINSLLIASFLATKQSMKKTSNFLIVFLSIVDCLNGATTMPLFGLYLAISVNNPIIAKLLLLATMPLFICFGLISLNLTMLIACDRYIHMNPDLNRQSRLQKLFKKPNIYILIVCVTR